MDIARFKRKPLMGIVRGLEKKSLKPLIDTVVDAGLEALEITMNTKAAANLIAEAVRLAHGRLAIGASIFKEEWLVKNDFTSIRRALDAYLRQLNTDCIVM